MVRWWSSCFRVINRSAPSYPDCLQNVKRVSVNNGRERKWHTTEMGAINFTIELEQIRSGSLKRNRVIDFKNLGLDFKNYEKSNAT